MLFRIGESWWRRQRCKNQQGWSRKHLVAGVATCDGHIDSRERPRSAWIPHQKITAWNNLRLVRYSYQVTPQITGEIKRCDPARARTMRFSKGSLSIAENIYPHAESFTFSEVAPGVSSSRLYVTLLTRLFVERASQCPSARENMERKPLRERAFA